MNRQVASFVITYVGYDKYEASCENCVVVNGYYNGTITQTMRRALTILYKHTECFGACVGVVLNVLKLWRDNYARLYQEVDC